MGVIIDGYESGTGGFASDNEREIYGRHSRSSRFDLVDFDTMDFLVDQVVAQDRKETNEAVSYLVGKNFKHLVDIPANAVKLRQGVSTLQNRVVRLVFDPMNVGNPIVYAVVVCQDPDSEVFAQELGRFTDVCTLVKRTNTSRNHFSSYGFDY